LLSAAKILAVATALLILSGCSSAPKTPTVPPLSSKMVTAAIAPLADTNPLIGDAVDVVASVELDGKRKDKVVLRIERSSDGVTWEAVDEVRAEGPKVELTTNVVFDTAGPTHLRATALSSDKKARVLASTEPQPATVSDLQQLVRTFYYDKSQAYAAGTAVGIAFDEAHNYPAFADFASPAWQERNKTYTDAQATISTVPALTTLSPDPAWKTAAGTCNVGYEAPPAGRTYIVSVDLSVTWNGFTDTSKHDVHVTYLEGQLYHWVGC
jgi:hypothetical protein